MSNFKAEICSVWKILMKTCLVMVTVIKRVHLYTGNCKLQNCFGHPKRLTVSTQILNLLLLSDDSSNETKNSILKKSIYAPLMKRKI